MVPWLTRSADNSRSGWNPNEKTLTQATVESKGIVRATIIPVFGDARGMEAQPLILPSVKLKDGSTHDVMVLPVWLTMSPVPVQQIQSAGDRWWPDLRAQLQRRR
jgi:hypothetical protein